MNRRAKIGITAAVIVLAVPVLAGVAVEIVLNSTGVKSEIENIVGQALDMTFKIEGDLDFANKRYHMLTLALIDPNGCIINKEIVDGPFDQPEVKDTSIIIRTVIRPLGRFLQSDCESFYRGSVSHPATTRK